LIFPSESTDPQFITVPVIGNNRHQPTHKFNVHLLNAIQAVLNGLDGQGDIVDDDPVPTVTISDVSVGETTSGTVNAVLRVTLSNDTDDLVTVNYSTVDGSAISPADYAPASGTLTFQPGITSQVMTITVNAATMGEGRETFYVDLAGLTGATMAKSRGVVTITPPTSWVTSTTAEFGAGIVGAGAYVADTAGGEITLAPIAGTEFSGTSLPAGWISQALTASGGSTVANGSIRVNGAVAVAPATFTAGRTLEFVATFSGAPFQNVGFGLTSPTIPPLAMFGVKADGQLYARALVTGQALETAIPGSWFAAPHRFRIDWTTANVVYWIDGTRLVTHTITYAGTAGAMRPAIMDLSPGGAAVSVDWMRTTPYAASGSYTSLVYNAGAPVVWNLLTWLADMPVTGGTVLVEVRTGTTPLTAAGTNWTAFRTIARSGDAIGSTGQYAQYRLTLSTAVANTAPAVKEVVLTFTR
jgi:hypothetical protein